MRPLLSVAFVLPCLCAPVEAPASPLASQLDALFAARYAKEGPGAAVLIARDGKAIYRKGFGMASVELKTPIRPDFRFRIGSVTKQFTAAAILLLAEDGKVDLKAPVSTYLPFAPKTWEGVTVEMLLNHTSGIPSYTSDLGFAARGREDFTPQGLMEAFALKKPLEFAPGANHVYNNSGFFLLGMIIEKVSGKTWDTFLKSRVFEPLGMKHTGLGTETELIPDLVQGYTGGPRPAPYVSMTQPGAAGALVSTVDDLARWTFALHGGKVLKSTSLAKMLTATRTSDGKTHPYGYGIGFRSQDGRNLVAHGGGINGFVCMLTAEPATRTVAVILNNTDEPSGSDDYYIRRMLAFADGKSIPTPKAVAVPKAQLEPLAGTYQVGAATRRFVMQGDQLAYQAGGRTLPLMPIGQDRFQPVGIDLVFRFVREQGRVKGYHRIEDGGPEGDLNPRKEGEAPTASKPAVPPEAFDPCAGEYELVPGFVLRFWREGDKIYTQATGQPRAEIYAERELTYALKVVDARVVFEKGADGKVTGLVLHQGGRQMPAKRIK